jgi:hypothetical protein
MLANRRMEALDARRPETFPMQALFFGELCATSEFLSLCGARERPDLSLGAMMHCQAIAAAD